MMTLLDWAVVGLFVGALLATAFYLQRYMRSVADFLAANRTAGRYMLTIAYGSSAVGAISLIAGFQMYMDSGLTPAYWQLMLLPVSLVIAATGWVVYRFRETRALTLGQFFELRYSRRIRIFMGLLCFFSGILNYGIFPGVTARFFMSYCGMPETFAVLGLDLPTFPMLMLVQLSVALLFILTGGQVSIMVTDFLQGQAMNIAMLVIIAWVAFHIGWHPFAEAVMAAPEHVTLIDPFQEEGAKSFDMVYFLIAVVGSFYATMAWQGSQAYNASARNPHEARMGALLAQWRAAVVMLLPMIAAVGAWSLLHHDAFQETAASVEGSLAGVSDPQERSQLVTPMALLHILPAGMMGLFLAVMISATVSTDNTYIHSWGSIFVQDVLIPVIGRPLDEKSHLLALRLAAVGVAIFAFVFSLIFRQTQHILLFMVATGAVFMGGAGSVIIGGLYWKNGTTRAAWTAMILAASLALGGMLARQFDSDFPLNGQHIYFLSICVAIVSYVVVSLLENRKFDLDRILHRGEWARLLPREEREKVSHPTGWSALKPGPDFTRWDRVILYATLGWAVVMFGVFILLLLVHFVVELPPAFWLNFWGGFLVLLTIKAVVVTVWFLIGGVHDLRSMLFDIRTATARASDDGFVQGGTNRDETNVRKLHSVNKEEIQESRAVKESDIQG